MTETGALIIGFIAFLFTFYSLVDSLLDYINKECSVWKFCFVFIAFLFVVNKFWEVVN